MKQCIMWRVCAVTLAILLCILPLVGCGLGEAPGEEATPTPGSKSLATPAPAPDTPAPVAEIPSVSKEALDEAFSSYVLDITFEVLDPTSEDMSLDIQIQSQSTPWRETMNIVGTQAGEQQHLRIYRDDDLSAVMDLAARQPEWVEDEMVTLMTDLYSQLAALTIDPMVEVCDVVGQGAESVDGRSAQQYALDQDDLKAALTDEDTDITTTAASCEIWVDDAQEVVLKAELEGTGQDADGADYLVHIVWEVSRVNKELAIAVPSISLADGDAGAGIQLLPLESRDSFQLETEVKLHSQSGTRYFNAWHDWVGQDETRLIDLVLVEPEGSTNISIYGEKEQTWARLGDGDYELVDGTLFQLSDEMNVLWLVDPRSLVQELVGVPAGVETVNGQQAMRYIADTSQLADHADLKDADPDGSIEYWVAEDEPLLLKVIMDVTATPELLGESVEIEYSAEVVALDELGSIERPADLEEIEPSIVRPTRVPPVPSSRPTQTPVFSEVPQEFFFDDLVMPDDLDSYRLYRYIYDDTLEEGSVLAEGVEEKDLVTGEAHVVTYISGPDGKEWEEYIQTTEGTWLDDGTGFGSADIDVLSELAVGASWACSDWDSLTREPGILVAIDDFMGREAWRYDWELEDFCGVGPANARVLVDAEMLTPLLIAVESARDDSSFYYEYSVTDANQPVNVVSPRDLPAPDATYIAKGMTVSGRLGSSESWYKVLAMPYELLDTHMLADDPDMDAILTAFDAQGNEISWNDDGPVGFLPWMVYRPEHAGVLYIMAEAYDDEARGDYELWHGVFEGTTFDDAERLEAGVYSGVITEFDRVVVEYYDEMVYGIVGYLDLERGDELDITCLADTLGSPLDPVVHLFDAEGQIVVSDDDGYGDGSSLDSHLIHTVESAGRHYVMVQSYNAEPYGDDFEFELTILINE